MPLNILEVEILDVGGIDFMGLFVSLFTNYYIFVVVYYVSKWIKAKFLLPNDAKTTLKLQKK